MRRSTRSQRKKEHRNKRIERALKNLNRNDKNLKYLSKANKITLLVIIFIFVGLNFFSFFVRQKSKVFDFDENNFRKKYELYLKENKEAFIYDKSIKDIVKNQKEHSFVQESTDYTNSLIAVHSIKDGRIKNLAVVGVVKENEDYEKAYIENMILLTGIVFNQNYEKSKKILKDIEILDENTDIVKSNNFKKIKIYKKEISFSYKKNDMIFNIENE